MQLRKYKARCSGIHLIMGQIGLTEKQQERLNILEEKKVKIITLTEKQESRWNELIKKGETKMLTEKQADEKEYLSEIKFNLLPVGLTKTEEEERINLTNKKENPELPQTLISHLEAWVKEEIYSRTREFSNKYTRKGNAKEDEAIEFASEVMGWGMVFKNTVRHYNEWIEGEMDIVLKDSIEDIKCSWDCFTFPLFDDELPTKGYDYQLQGYMALTDRKEAGVNYCLMDAPIEEVEREAVRQSYENGMNGEVDADLFDEVLSKMTYSHFPNHLRHKRFAVKRDDAFIQSVYDRVELCRKYINDVILPTLKK